MMNDGDTISAWGLDCDFLPQLCMDLEESRGPAEPASKRQKTTATLNHQISSSSSSSVTASSVNQVPDAPRGFHLLGETLFLGSSVYNGVVKIHIREFALKEKQWIPTKKGVTFSPYLWDVFSSNVNEFNVHLPNKAFSVGNKILFATDYEGKKVTAQYMMRNSHDNLYICAPKVSMSVPQFENIFDFQATLNQQVRDLQFRTILKELVLFKSSEKSPTPTTIVDNGLLFKQLFNAMVVVLKDCVTEIANAYPFYCPECEVSEPQGNQLAHLCINPISKIERFYFRAISDINMHDVASNLIVKTPNVNRKTYSAFFQSVRCRRTRKC